MLKSQIYFVSNSEINQISPQDKMVAEEDICCFQEKWQIRDCPSSELKAFEANVNNKDSDKLRYVLVHSQHILTFNKPSQLPKLYKQRNILSLKHFIRFTK